MKVLVAQQGQQKEQKRYPEKKRQGKKLQRQKT